MLIVKNLYKSFGGVNVINNLSFSLKENSITALIGPNGSGKSTLFNCINNITPVDSGNIIYKGINITNKSIEYISNLGISRLLQHTQLCENLSVLDNLLLGYKNNQRNIFSSIFSIENNKSKIDIIKKYLCMIGLEDKIDIRANELSYGQQRLIEFIRLFLKPTNLMLLDEPTAGVHPDIKKKMILLFKKLKSEGQTILFIEHDLHFAFSIADFVIVMDEGKILYYGSPEYIKDNPKIIDSYLGK